MKILPTLVLGCYALAALSLGAALFDAAHERTSSEYSLSLTVITPAYESATGVIAPFGPGYERDLLAEFCKDTPCDIRWVKAPDRETALDMLAAGSADVAVGFTGDSQPRTGIAVSPVYHRSTRVEVQIPVEVQGPVAASAVADDEDAARSYWLDGRSWALWEPFTPLASGVSSGVAGPEEDYHWFWRTRNPSLHHALTTFWNGVVQPGNPLLAQLEERYFGYLPTRMDPYAVMDLMYLLKRRLPRYSDIIAGASDRADINPLLFTAVIIQESRLDESTVSHTGVRGIMQLTTETAAYLKVDRMNPRAAIGAGARYLQMLWKDLEPLELDEWDRWFFTLAAFNQGPRRLEGAMELSRKLGGTGRTWTELKEVYPLLSQKKYAQMVGQNTCRGQEAVNFVERVRWSYHILRGLVALDRPEAQNLAPLLGSLDRATLGL